MDVDYIEISLKEKASYGRERYRNLTEGEKKMFFENYSRMQKLKRTS